MGKPTRSRPTAVGVPPVHDTPIHGEATEQGSLEAGSHETRALGELSWDLMTRRALKGEGGG